MTVLTDIQTRAAAHPAHVVLSEGRDPRIIDAAVQATELGIASITLVGSEREISDQLTRRGGRTSEALRIEDPSNSPLTNLVSDAYFDLRKHKGVTAAKAASAALDPLVFAAMLVRLGHADGTVGGAVASTSSTVRAALQVIGKAPGADLVSSFFLMVLPEDHPSGRVAMIFSDCGLVIDPSASELALIASQSAASYATLLNEPPRIAMLSFSTKGSAKHPNVTKVAEASTRIREQYPDIASDGELQFDAAFVPSVAATKAPGSKVAGTANVMIFPNLDAGNIGYKIAERIGGCTAIGPVLQGLSRPANDLSRGCTADDILNMIAVTVLQAARFKA